MNKIEKLIEDLCPEGVPFQSLETLSELRSGDRVTKSMMTSNAEFPLFGGGTTPTGRYHSFNAENSVTISRAGSAGFVNFVAGKFWATDVCFVASEKDRGVNVKFLYYWLKNHQPEFSKQIYGGSMPKLNKKYLWELAIPAPPLRIQLEIVSILDKFTELEAELEAELESRIGQYQITKSEVLKPKPNWVMATLGDFGRVAMCKRVFKDQTATTGDIPFFKIGTFGKEPDSFIDYKLFEEYRSKFSYPRMGDILLSASGTIGRRVVFDGKDSYFQDSNIIWLEHDESKILNRYLYHWFSTVDWKTEGGTISRLYNSNFLSTQVLVPPLDEQSAIAETLDSFEVFTTDKSIGLPAELGRRRQQYEYYRNKLLTFEELDAA